MVKRIAHILKSFTKCVCCGCDQQHQFWSSQGWGLLSQFPPFRYFPNFSVLPKHTLSIEDHVYIWQVSPQLSCGDICLIWMWCEESNRYFSRIENFAYGEFNERSFSNPHPWTLHVILFHCYSIISILILKSTHPICVTKQFRKFTLIFLSNPRDGEQKRLNIRLSCISCSYV